MGFSYLGHTEKSNHPKEASSDDKKKEAEKPKEEQKASEFEKVFIGDDLGSDRYLAANVRLDFLDIPFLRDIHLKTFLYGDIAYYPSSFAGGQRSLNLLENTRLSTGFGLALPLGVTNLLLYFNTMNFNVKKGIDYEKEGFISFNLGFL